MGIDFQENWFVNRTDVEFPLDVKWLLSLGPKFALPIRKGEMPLFKIIADGEEMIKTMEQGVQETARSNFTYLIQSHIRTASTPHFDRFLNKVYDSTRKFLRHQKHIYIVPADKGNVTVAIYKADYVNKMKDLMADRGVYRALRCDPTSTLQAKNNNFVKKLFENDIVSEFDKRRMTTYTANSPRIYGLPKIHKEGMPLRPICASTSVPCYELSKFMVKLLQKITENSVYNVRNASDFIQAVSPVRLDEDDILVSFDVVSLFTSIPIHLVLTIVEKKWDIIKEHTRIKKTTFIEILRFCIIDNNYVQFNGLVYQQKQGVPMGSPASPILADIVMEALLDEVLNKLVRKPKIVTKYVDDLFAVVKSSDVNDVLTALNSFNSKLKFTVEVEKQGALPYLDVKVIRKNSNIIFDWYKKPTSSGRLINFNSKQPKGVILNTAQNFINRVLGTSNIIFREKNTNIIRNTLWSNSFPVSLINKLLSNYVRERENKTPTDDTQPVLYRSSLYIPLLSDRMLSAPIRNKEKTKIAFRPVNPLRTHLFTNTKGRIDDMERSNVVYQINCLGRSGVPCSSVYIGTSKQKLKKRLSGHRSDINNGGEQKTALALHCLKEKHEPDLKRVKILETEKHHAKRFLLEMLHINNAENAVNRRSDCENLSSAYSQLIKRHNYMVSSNKF